MIPAIFGTSGAQLTPDERAFFKDADPVGYILFGRNCENREQLRRLTDDLRSLQGRDDLIVSIDQEGGRVARMRPPEWSRFPAGQAFDELYQIAPASAIEAVRLNAEAMARELFGSGVTVNFHAPFDVRRPQTVDAIGDRALGGEPKQVAALGRAVLQGMARGGVVGCLKHMPGHGRATVDSHAEMPVVHADASELQEDIAPFAALADHPLGMTCHLMFPAWDPDNPATQSRIVIEDIIRGAIGFDGLLLTDDIDMEALEGTVPERSERALAAGCDVTLNCWGTMDDMIGIAERNPTLTDAATRRLDRVRAAIGPAPESYETAGLLARRDALFSAAEAGG